MKEATEPMIPFAKLKSTLRKFYHELVNSCGISMSHMTTDMFHLS